jgi:hypothetical protein
MERTPSMLSRALVIAVAATLAVDPIVFAQQPAAAPQAAPKAQAAPAAGEQIFSQKDLDEILAPIALYPDALLAQVFMASTYPLEVVQAARWQEQNKGLKDKALEDALKQQPWDPAVKSLVTVPQVLTMMNEKLDWTTKLGDAVLAQQDDVMKTVQMLRGKADEAGNLKTSEQMVVTKETQQSTTVIKIESPNPEVVYVPTYNPATVYGTWWYPYPPPYYYYPPGWGYGYYYPGLAFATGVFVGAAIWGGLAWGGCCGSNNININSNRFNNFNGSNIGGGDRNWGHNVDHRKGVSYRDNASAKKYNRGGDRQAAASREQFRGRADAGRQQLSQMDRGQLNRATQTGNRAAGDRGGAGNRGGGAQATPRTASTGNRGGGNAGSGNYSGRNNFSSGTSQRSSSNFSGSRGSSGASTRAASSRGSASRGGGGGRGGGGRR